MQYTAKTYKKRRLSPKEFLKLSPSEKKNIASSKIIPPKLGQNDFGSIEVFYKDPIYHVEL